MTKASRLLTLTLPKKFASLVPLIEFVSFTHSSLPFPRIMGKAKEVLPGLSAAGRSKSYHRRGLWAIKKKNGGKFPTHAKKEAKAAVEAKVSYFFFCFSPSPETVIEASRSVPEEERVKGAKRRESALFLCRD